MNSLNITARILKSNGVVRTYSEFSRDFCGKNVNWTSYQQHKKRDFSISAAMNCLSNIQVRAKAIAKMVSVSPPSLADQLDALQLAEQLVRNYLWEKHGIAINDRNIVFIHN
jgi:hypothetical protein